MNEIKIFCQHLLDQIRTKNGMITQVTISTRVNDEGKTEYVQTWEWIRKEDRQPDAKQMSGERNMWLVDRIEKKPYPEFATDDKRLTATGAYNFLMDKSIDRVYNNFKDWQHIPIKTAIIAVLVIVGVGYAIFLVV